MTTFTIDTDNNITAHRTPEKATATTPFRKAKGGAQAAKGAPKGKLAAKTQEATAPRDGSKPTQVVAMLQRKSGAPLVEIMEKMRWQKPTVRGFMAGAMKKAGFTVESFKLEGGERTYSNNK